MNFLKGDSGPPDPPPLDPRLISEELTQHIKRN